jgi:aryl-alcohol dehydrogenase
VVVVGPDVDLTIGAPFGCSIQTGAGAVLNVLQPDDRSSFALFGAGAVGLAALMAARAAGVKHLVAVDPLPERRQMATDLGATAVVDPTTTDAVEAVRDSTGGGATHALDTSGVPGVIKGVVAALRARGTLVGVGLGNPEVTVDMSDVVANGKSLRGCIEGDARPSEFLPRLLDLQSRGDLPVERIISHYPLDRINDAVADAPAARPSSRSWSCRGRDDRCRCGRAGTQRPQVAVGGRAGLSNRHRTSREE